MTMRTTVIRELSLREMLADSIVKAVMARDAITARDVARVLVKARARVGGSIGCSVGRSKPRTPRAV